MQFSNFNFSQHVKYMPMGYDRPKVVFLIPTVLVFFKSSVNCRFYLNTLTISISQVVPCPAPSTSSSGGGFNLWSFMTAGVVAATVVGNIVDNVNDNNNNNNNNNNQDNQNSNNMNFNNNDNMNMNMNMLNMAMGRGLTEEWVKEEVEDSNKETTREIQENEEVVILSSSSDWMMQTAIAGKLLLKLVCKVLTHWMEVRQRKVKIEKIFQELTVDCAGRIICEAAQRK